METETAPNHGQTFAELESNLIRHQESRVSGTNRSIWVNRFLLPLQTQLVKPRVFTRQEKVPVHSFF